MSIYLSVVPHIKFVILFHCCTIELVAVNPIIVCTFLLSPVRELHQREYLDKCLSRALNIPLNDKKRITAIDDENYVLTLDFTIKMLQIHERRECGEPVIIQGETGVGKTALIQMLSKLWNTSLDTKLKQLREQLLEFLQNELKHGKYVGK